MFMPIDRQPLTRQPHFTPMPDATGTPFAPRSKADGARSIRTEPRDFREQADGAP